MFTVNELVIGKGLNSCRRRLDESEVFQSDVGSQWRGDHDTEEHHDLLPIHLGQGLADWSRRLNGPFHPARFEDRSAKTVHLGDLMR